MHRIVQAHLENFAKSFGIESLGQDVQFEMFSNKSILTPHICTDFELDDVTTSEADDGTDGIAIIIDEELCLSPEDTKTIFDKPKRNHDVEIHFIQSKTSESYDLGDFLKFKESVLKFVDIEDDYHVHDDLQNNAREIFDVIIKNVPKIRDGKPKIFVKYVATGVYKSPKELDNARKRFIAELAELGFFSEINIEFIDRDKLTKLWVSTYSNISAELPTFSLAPLPSINGIDEAYLAVVKAEDYVNNLLLTEDGTLRGHVFFENVRSFLGVDNNVNAKIAETIRNKEAASRFPVLNNGITIVSPDVRVQNNNIHLENFQVVNGCQTSNVLYECRELLDSNMMLNLKIVETSNEDVFSELVRATNSQTKVDENQFLSLKPIAKKVEAYFDSFDGEDARLFLERRDRQFAGRDIPAIRIFPLNLAVKCVASVFFRRPDLAYRYPQRMYEQLAEKIFADDIKEVVYYTACLALYRFNLLTSNADIPQNIRKYKWHIIAIACILVAGKVTPKPNSKKMETYCKKIIDKFSKHDADVVALFGKAVSIVTTTNDLSDDKMKRQSSLEDLIKEI
ncbi:AIPR family protein [Pantoea sp. Fr+CA_20]|uniref:AIPR family protein n=1 Tax=Pantoea TaxID=53335 RepID=UPI0021173DD5|nr:AIPR family protein [Pantoea sp. Fr+CA_20]